MKKNILIFFVSFCAVTLFAGKLLAGGSEYGPKGKRFGAGIIAGEPTGISLKGYLSRYLALELLGRNAAELYRRLTVNGIAQVVQDALLVVHW